MDKFVEKILKRGLGNIIDKDMNKLTFSDKLFLKYNKEEKEHEKKYLALDLNQHDKMIIDDYIDCIQTTNVRIVDLAFLAGIRDTIRFLNGLDMIKGSKVRCLKRCLENRGDILFWYLPLCGIIFIIYKLHNI